jgi:hypothetical protein
MPRPHRRPRAVALTAAFAAAAAFAAPGAAEPLLGPITFYGERDSDDGFWLYGQVNKGFLVHDDGQKTELYPLVDNAASSTRFGAWLRRRAADDLVFAVNFEVQWNPYSTFSVNRLNADDIDWETHTVRKGEAIAETGFGTFSFGQGSSASDGTTETDLSGATLAAYSSVADTAGGQILALEGGGLSNTFIRSAFGNLDGLGRLFRARWDSPSLAGFSVSTSAGTNLLYSDVNPMNYDAALRYEAEMAGVQVAAAAAAALVAEDFMRYSGSASALHAASGFNATLAGGYDDLNGGRYGYLKLGWKRVGLITSGATAVAIDATTGRDRLVTGSETLSFGLAAVQQVADGGVDLYAGLRFYDVEAPGQDFESALSFLTGARLSF